MDADMWTRNLIFGVVGILDLYRRFSKFNPGEIVKNSPGLKFYILPQNPRAYGLLLANTYYKLSSEQRLQFVLGEDFLQGFGRFLQVGRFLFVDFKRDVCLYTVSAHDSRHTQRNTRNAVLAFH